MYLTLENYLLSAKRILIKYGCGYLCKDEDAISHVAEFMMKADQKFDGSGSRDAFRVYYGRFGVLSYIRHKKSQPKNRSVDFYDYDGSVKSPDQAAEQKELIDNIFNSSNLSERQKKCLAMHYLEGVTLEAIGKELKVTRQRVQQIINDSIEQLRGDFHVESVQEKTCSK